MTSGHRENKVRSHIGGDVAGWIIKIAKQLTQYAAHALLSRSQLIKNGRENIFRRRSSHRRWRTGSRGVKMTSSSFRDTSTEDKETILKVG